MVLRLYCNSCRRMLSAIRFDLSTYADLPYKFCLDCEANLMTIAQERLALEGESAITALLWQREGGDREVVLEVGRADLVTDEYVIEVKHISKWMDGTKVLLYAAYLPSRKPRVHLFGLHDAGAEKRITEAMGRLGITVTFEDKPFE